MRRLLFPGFQKGKVKGLRPGDRPDHCIDLRGLPEDRLQGDTKEEARKRLEENCKRVPKLCHFGAAKSPDPASGRLSNWDTLRRRV